MNEMIARASANQAKASDPAASVFVSANAGTGKTKLLTDRVLRLLLSGAPADGILCVTYTRAAAAEMRNRIFKRLASWTIISGHWHCHFSICVNFSCSVSNGNSYLGSPPAGWSCEPV